MHELTKKYKHLFIYSHYLDKREDDNQNKSYTIQGNTNILLAFVV